MQWYLKVLRQYVDFEGRARRTEYWMFTLFTVIIAIVLAVLDSLLFGTQWQSIGWLGAIYALATLLPSLGVCVRRLHDTGRSGWWVLISLIPIIGAIVLLVFEVMEGNRGPNAYGPDPKGHVEAPIG